MKAKYSKRSKFGSRKVTVDNVTYDSIKEYNRYCKLNLLERSGEITGLKRQVKYDLIPSQRINNKVVERPVTYIADFVYRQNGELVVEDVKGFKTKEYIIKRKLMLYIYGIQISEV